MLFAIQIIDATAKTTEGIKSIITLKDDKPNEKRIKFPRVFYGYIINLNFSKNIIKIFIFKVLKNFLSNIVRMMQK